eukprot:EC791245.1.p1 GENE.EC791245.1~~EC791245.1.p1  ORF type:complete len:122 (+),score=25.94 EC791245.1:159-524(+)
MGKVEQLVRANIMNGETIACAVPCHHLITAGVSNWAASALACALYAIHAEEEPLTCPSRRAFLDPDFEESVLRLCVECGAIVGILGQAVMSVDGFEWEAHRRQIVVTLCELMDSFVSTTSP